MMAITSVNSKSEKPERLAAMRVAEIFMGGVTPRHQCEFPDVMAIVEFDI
jgi:hypothetical protein